MADRTQIADHLAGRLRAGLDTLRDPEGRPATLAIPLGDEDTVELGLNPQGGPILRLRHRMDRASADQREARMADLVRLTAAARFGTGWIGGCEPDNVLTLAVPLDPGADSARIAALIGAASAILRGERARPAAAATTTPEPVVGHDWLRL